MAGDYNTLSLALGGLRVTNPDEGMSSPTEEAANSLGQELQRETETPGTPGTPGTPLDRVGQAAEEPPRRWSRASADTITGTGAGLLPLLPSERSSRTDENGLGWNPETYSLQENGGPYTPKKARPAPTMAMSPNAISPTSKPLFQPQRSQSTFHSSPPSSSSSRQTSGVDRPPSLLYNQPNISTGSGISMGSHRQREDIGSSDGSRSSRARSASAMGVMPSRRDVAEGRTYRPHSQQVPFPPRRSSRRESHRSEAPRSSQPAKKGPKDFNFGRTLGEGSYSTVLAATDRQTHKEYAIKVLDKRHIIKERKVKYVNIERDTLNRLTDHPGIVRLYYTFQDDRSLYFVLDLASGGELLGVLKKTGTFDIECTRFYGAEILDSIAYMHSRGVIHRDLKPENVLLDRGMHVKVTDFGTAKILADPSTADSDGQDENSDRAVSFVGTAEYVSPELLRDKNACKASDLWAFGCIVYQLLVGRPPFKAPNEYLTFQKILALDYSFPDGFPDQAKDLVQRLLVLEPSQRLSLDQIQRHPFFEGIAWGRGLWRQRTPRLKPYAPPPFAPIQLNSGGGAATPAAVKQLRRITELPPPSQLDIDWSPVLTGSNERILKLGNLQVLSAGAAGEAATNTTKLSRFFGGGTAKKRERLVIVTTDARLIIAAAGGNEKKAKAEVNLLAPGTSWSEFIDPKGITAWQLDTKEKHITFDDTRPASSSSDTTREWLDALTQAREMALSTDADQGSNHLQDSSSFSAISSPADSLAVQKQHRKQQLSNGHETAPPEKKKRFSKRHSKSGLAAVF